MRDYSSRLRCVNTFFLEGRELDDIAPQQRSVFGDPQGRERDIQSDIAAVGDLFGQAASN